MTRLASMDDFTGERVGASYRRGLQYVGGYLYFDDSGIAFDSAISNTIDIGVIRIEYRDIVGLDTYRMLGLRNTGLIVHTADGGLHRIVVNKRSRIIEFMNSKISPHPG